MARPNLQIKSLSPNIPKAAKEPSHNKLRPPPSRTCRSSSSATASFSRKLLPIKLKIGKTSLEHSNLTEVSLDEHNRKQAAEIRRQWGTSPYYKGLTDSALYLNRVKNGGLSPCRESRFSARTSSSISTVFTKINEWGASCFKGKPGSIASAVANSNSDSAAASDARTDPPPIATTVTATARMPARNSRVSVSAIQDVIEIGSMRGKFVRPVERSSPVEEKPLRESVVMFPIMNSERDERKRSVEETATKEREFVWADRHRPNALNDFICNRDRATYLRDIVAQAKCSHFIFEGPPGVGKRTMIWALLKDVYGAESLTMKEEWKEFHLKGEAMPNLKVRMKVSAHHVEINLSELRGYERHVIVDLVKQSDNVAEICDPTSNCRTIVLHESDKLSTDAQHYIRWVMERYKNCNKIIFSCSDVSKLQPVRSLCEHIQLLPPSNVEIVEVLEFIAKQESIELPRHLAEKIADNSKQNLRQAIRSFEASWQLNYPFIENQVILTGWEDVIANIAKNIIDEQSPKQLYIIRGKLQKLIEHSVSPEFIFSTLVEELKKHLDEKYKPKIDALYLEYNRDGGFLLDGENSVVLLRRPEEASTMRKSDPVKKNIYHFMKIEEFTAKFMSFYKSCVKKQSEENG
ncbi:replication factor C subunit 3-like [Aristolochia californica]|uniref:replication factor C subunit 3-like n=1 Tax=Aristolochia californica TaxID=171875 RepID=UPI0035D85087